MAPKAKIDITKDQALFNAYKNLVLQQQRKQYLDALINERSVVEDYLEIQLREYLKEHKELDPERIAKEKTAELERKTQEQLNKLELTAQTAEIKAAEQKRIKSEQTAEKRRINDEKNAQKKKLTAELEKQHSNVTREQMITATLKDREAAFLQRNMKKDDDVLQFIADENNLKNETAIANILNLPSKKVTLDNLSKSENTALKEDAFFDSSFVKHIYGPKTDVTKLSAYTPDFVATSTAFGPTRNFGKEFYIPNLDKIQAVQIDVPKSINNKIATLITLGEYVNPKYKKNILKDYNKLSLTESNFNDTTNYEMIIMEYSLGDANYKRPNEYALIQAGAAVRTSAKKIIENVDKDPAKAVKNIEAIIRTYSAIAYHKSSEAGKDILPHIRIVRSAFETLSNPLFAQYVTLTKAEKENTKALIGYSKSLQTLAVSENAYKLAQFEAKMNGIDKKLNESQDLRELYIDYAVNTYIHNYYRTIFREGGKIEEKNKEGSNLTAIGTDPFSVAYEANPNFVKQRVRNMLLNDETFKKELNEATTISGVDKFKSIKVENPGRRLLGNSPEKFRNSLNIINNKLQEHFKKYSKKLFPDPTNAKLVETIRKAEKDWNTFVADMQKKDPVGVEDLSQARQQLSEIVAGAEGFEPYRESAVLNQKQLSYLDGIKSVAAEYEGYMREELSSLEKHDPIVQATEKLNSLKENIEYQQYKIRVKLDMAKKLIKPVSKVESPTEEQQKAFKKNMTKIMEDVSVALAEIIVNKSVQERMETKGNTLSMEDIVNLTKPENIRKSAIKMSKTPEFKKLITTINIETIAANAADPANMKFPVKGVEALQKAYAASKNVPMENKQPNAVEQKGGLVK